MPPSAVPLLFFQLNRSPDCADPAVTERLVVVAPVTVSAVLSVEAASHVLGTPLVEDMQSTVLAVAPTRADTPVATIVPAPVTPNDAPVPTSIAAPVLVPPVIEENAVAAPPPTTTRHVPEAAGEKANVTWEVSDV